MTPVRLEHRGLTMTALILGPDEKARLAALTTLAVSKPVNIREVAEKVQTATGKAEHMKAMSEQTIDLPLAYAVTFSIEEGHPIGTVRHVSVSLHGRRGLLPSPAAVWTIALELGFTGSGVEDADYVWLENLQGHGRAVNVVQRTTQPLVS